MRMRVALLLAVGTVTSCSRGSGGGPAPDSGKAITAYAIANPAAPGTIDEGAKTIAVTVPHGTNVGALVATFTSTGASVRVGSAAQVSGVTPNDFTNPVNYVVTAADGTATTYTVTVTVAPVAAKALTSFSFLSTSPPSTGTIDESAKTVAVTVPYGTDPTTLVATFTTTGASVSVASTVQVSGVTPNNFKNAVDYVVTAADQSFQIYTVTVTVAPSPEKAFLSFAFDALGAVGTIDENQKTISVTVPYGTDVTALVAFFATTGTSVVVGSTVQESGRTPNDFTSPVIYVVTAADLSFATYTVTVTVAPDPATRITAFSFASPASTGTIDDASGTISLTVPYGTDVTRLVATFETTAASVTVGGTQQVSGTTPNDFTGPVSYVVTAPGGASATYVVTVVVAATSAKAITSFAFAIPLATGIIDEGAKTIVVQVPFGTDLTALVATFETTGAKVEVGSTLQTSGVTPNDFSNPVAYVVTAADGSKATYTVTIPPTAGAVQGTITLPSSPAGVRCYLVRISTGPTSGAVAWAAGTVSGSTISYSIGNVPPGTYYLAAGVDNDESDASPPLCSYVSATPTRGDFVGFYGGPMPPSQPNVFVSAGATLTANFALMTY